MSNDGNVRDVEKPEEVNFENLEPTQKSKLVTFSASSMLNAASGTVMVKLSNAFKEFEIEGFKSKTLYSRIHWIYDPFAISKLNPHGRPVFVWYHIRFNKC